MTSYPELLDIGIMGHCVHGSSGLCIKSGVQCYQNGLKTKFPNMSFENFKRIVDECKGKTFQFALGGRGDVDQHEDFEKILKYCRPLGLGLSRVGCWETQSLFLPQLVMRYWEPVPRGPVLWETRTEPWATWVPLLCFVLHVMSWLLIFSILLVFDYAELMGLKQVRLPDPYPRHLILSRIPLSPPRMSLCLPLSSICLLFLIPSPPFLIR